MIIYSLLFLTFFACSSTDNVSTVKEPSQFPTSWSAPRRAKFLNHEVEILFRSGNRRTGLLGPSDEDKVFLFDSEDRGLYNILEIEAIFNEKEKIFP